MNWIKQYYDKYFFCYSSLMLKGLEIWVQLWSCILWRAHLLSFHLIISKLFLRRNFENIFVLASFSCFHFPTFSSTYLKNSVRLSKIFLFLQGYNYTIHQSQYVTIRVHCIVHEQKSVSQYSALNRILFWASSQCPTLANTTRMPTFFTYIFSSPCVAGRWLPMLADGRVGGWCQGKEGVMNLVSFIFYSLYI